MLRTPVFGYHPVLNLIFEGKTLYIYIYMSPVVSSLLSLMFQDCMIRRDTSWAIVALVGFGSINCWIVPKNRNMATHHCFKHLWLLNEKRNLFESGERGFRNRAVVHCNDFIGTKAPLVWVSHLMTFSKQFKWGIFKTWRPTWRKPMTNMEKTNSLNFLECKVTLGRFIVFQFWKKPKTLGLLWEARAVSQTVFDNHTVTSCCLVFGILIIYFLRQDFKNTRYNPRENQSVAPSSLHLATAVEQTRFRHSNKLGRLNWWRLCPVNYKLWFWQWCVAPDLASPCLLMLKQTSALELLLCHMWHCEGIHACTQAQYCKSSATPNHRLRKRCINKWQLELWFVPKLSCGHLWPLTVFFGFSS